MTEIQQVVVEPFNGPAEEWDAAVRAHPGWTHFQLFGWRSVMERALGHECVYLAARDVTTRRIVALLPLVRVRSIVFGHYLVSMPFVNYGGPLGDEEGIRAVTKAAADLARRGRVKLLELRSRRALPIDLPVSHRKLTVVLDLPSTPDELWKSLPAKLRSQIRRPQKDGVTVRFGADQIGAFHRVFARHMRDLGTPAQPQALFEAIADAFPDDAEVAVAYHGDAPIACGFGFLWDGEFEITWASSLRSHRAMSPNMLVYWALMERMLLRGARRFNFGRCTRDSGTHRFKMQWGGREESLWWYQVNEAGAGDANASTPSPDQGVFALATRVWQRLPVALATRLGPPIVRFIP